MKNQKGKYSPWWPNIAAGKLAHTQAWEASVPQAGGQRHNLSGADSRLRSKAHLTIPMYQAGDRS